jgi:hypothetical protein
MFFQKVSLAMWAVKVHIGNDKKSRYGVGSGCSITANSKDVPNFGYLLFQNERASFFNLVADTLLY